MALQVAALLGAHKQPTLHVPAAPVLHVRTVSDCMCPFSANWHVISMQQVHAADCCHLFAGMLAVWGSTQSTSRPVDALQPDGSPTLLLHLLHAIAPVLFPASSLPRPSAVAAAPADAAVEAAPAADSDAATPTSSQDTDPNQGQPAGTYNKADASPSGQGDGPVSDPLGAVVGNRPALPQPAATRSSSNAEPASDEAESAAGTASRPCDNHSSPHTVIVAGVQPSLDTPVAWLHAQLHAPDYFLYVVVHCAAAQAEAGSGTA